MFMSNTFILLRFSPSFQFLLLYPKEYFTSSCFEQLGEENIFFLFLLGISRNFLLIPICYYVNKRILL